MIEMCIDSDKFGCSLEQAQEEPHYHLMKQ